MGTVSYRKLSLGSVLVVLSVLASSGSAVSGSVNEGPFGGAGVGSFYIGLGYSPAFSKIRDFNVVESGGETMGVYPYVKSGKRVEFKSGNFNWDAPNPRIAFRDSLLTAVEGSIGYGVGGGRVEIEVGYEKFKTKGVKDGSGKIDDSDGVYILAKELANSVVMDQTSRLANAIGKLSKKEMHLVSNAINIVDPSIDSKFCKQGQNNEAGVPTAGKCAKVATSNPESKKTLSDEFPSTASTEKVDVVTSKTIATETAALTREEKGTVASVFAKVIEGAEVLETKGVSATSVMVNACYDLVSESIGVVPYACVGVGGEFVGVVESHLTPKLAYQLKAGLSYNVTEEVTAFLGGYYHRVLGDGQYGDLPLARLVDDTSAAGKTKEFGMASFGMAYFGGEFGVRFAF